jgi:Protein of unknown function (DUF2384)
MEELDKSKTASSPQRVEHDSDDLESILLQLQKHLQWTSENPERALQEIKKFVQEASVQLSRAGGATNQMFKDEDMHEQTTNATAEDFDQRPRSTELDSLLMGLVANPEAWLSAPSVHFGGRKPRDLIGTDEESKLFDLLQAVDQGLF